MLRSEWRLVRKVAIDSVSQIEVTIKLVDPVIWSLDIDSTSQLTILGIA